MRTFVPESPENIMNAKKIIIFDFFLTVSYTYNSLVAINRIFTPQAKFTKFLLEEGVLYDTLLPDYPNIREHDRPHQTTAITNASTF
jgi:hypothetical protein